MRVFSQILFLVFMLFTKILWAQPGNIAMQVWANEAIIATYTYDYQNFLDQQKQIAKYFMADGWIAYSQALQASGLPEQIQKNTWTVRAVATLPPKITTINATHWKAEMPILVVYSNKDRLQKQPMDIVITFTEAPSGQGVRGLAITSMNATLSKEPCKCDY